MLLGWYDLTPGDRQAVDLWMDGHIVWAELDPDAQTFINQHDAKCSVGPIDRYGYPG